MEERLKKVTRVEIIDEKGRSYVNWSKRNEVSISMQDDGRTMKVFISKKPKLVSRNTVKTIDADQSAADDYLDYLHSKY